MSKDASSNPITRVGTVDGAQDPYDHAINLIDTTIEIQEEIQAKAGDGRWRDLARKPTRTSVKEQLARRKYARWRQDRYDSKDGTSVAADEVEDSNIAPAKPKRPNADTQISEHAALDFANGDVDEAATPEAMDNKKYKHGSRPKEEFEIDILYENQRGSFFCGIPLYSHSSLLNFDPSPWVTKDFKDSAVNITNAQVPDPSWVWAWKTWYVDMSYDVDEEGWQYSFTFGRNFVWHGSHPWFHSFVRRRRWLRKRVKSPALSNTQAKPSALSAAHKLNTDYFTIHPKRDPSPGSAVDGPQTARPDSYHSYKTEDMDEEAPDDVKDIPSLLKVLRRATIDREKIDAVKKFVTTGGEELVYLKDHISEIMSFFIFQNSRRQLISFLKLSAVEAQRHRDEHDADEKPEGAAESRRIDNILKSVDAANKEIKDLEFWSDRKHVLRTTDEMEKSKDSSQKKTLNTRVSMPDLEEEPVGEIKGISEKAEIEMYEEEYDETRTVETKDKGKGRDIEEDEEPPNKNGIPGLGPDSMLIPDGDS